MRPLTALSLGLLSVLTSGCVGSEPNENATAETQKRVSADDLVVNSGNQEVPPSELSRKVSVQVRSWDEFQEWVTEQKGKVVVVDVWSTSCVPCVEEFSHFVELHDRTGDRIVCASFNIDYYGAGMPEDFEPKVLEFLTEKKATSANFLSSTPDEEVYDVLDVASPPAALVYDQSGKLKKTFKNDNNDFGPTGFNYEEHINPLVEELLKSVD